MNLQEMLHYVVNMPDDVAGFIIALFISGFVVCEISQITAFLFRFIEHKFLSDKKDKEDKK